MDDEKVVIEESLIYEGDDDEMDEGKDDEMEEKVEVIQEDVDVELQVEADNELEKDLEDGEVVEPEEEKKSKKTLRVHLPDLLQGIDGADEFPLNQETIEKLDKRAKRFNTHNPVKAEEVTKLYDSLGVPLQEREKRNSGKFRLEYIYMHGVFGLDVDEVLDYFEDYGPENVLDMSEDSCIVKFKNGISSLRAMIEISKPIGEPKKEERIVKHVLTADDEPERKVITRDTKVEFDEMVHPDDIPIEIPEGRWRLGKHHKKCEAVLLRFPTRADFKPAHYLANDKYKPRGPPIEVIEQEQEMKERNRNFDKKNPWADLCEDWSGPRKPREYEIPIEELDHLPRRLAIGMRDWDDPENQDHPVQIKPGSSRKRKILERLDFDRREEDTVTYYSEDEDEEEEDDEMNWKGKLKKPRMGMVADLEEKKTKKPDIRSRIAGASRPAKILKRKVDNSRFVVSEEVVEEYLSESDEDAEDQIYAEEARNIDLRHALTMKIENRPIKHAVRPSKKISDRFMGGSGEVDLERDTGEDLLDIENMKIEIRQYTSGESDMDVDKEEEEEIRRELRRRKEARMAKEKEAQRMKDVGDLRDTIKGGGGLGGGDLRDRMKIKKEKDSRREHDRDRDRGRERERDRGRDHSREKVRVKVEKEEGSSRSDRKETDAKRKTAKSKSKEMDADEEMKLIEQRKREIEELKREEKKLLEQKERKLREMQQKRDEDKIRAKKEREREREKREREKEKERQRELDRMKAKEKLREKERARRSRRKSESSEESSSDSDSSSSDDSDSESSSSSESSSEDDSSSGSDSDSSASESESEKKRKTSSKSSKRPPAKKEPEKKKSAKSESSTKASAKSSKDSKESKSSSLKPTAEDQKKASELRDKLKVYLNKAKAAKEEKKEKK